MKRFLLSCLVVAAVTGVAAYGGALVLEVGNPDANSEAKGMQALVVARVTACHEPAKSTVTASVLQLKDGRIQRTPLEVRPLATAGTFAVVGSITPNTAAIELAVTNPEYKNYEPRVLIRRDAAGIQWASLKRFFSAPPSAGDVKMLLEE
ncbi:MAG: hypothetical protein JWO80_3 [Bryobacterales bacterium]|nr:hypothetical protein [Bryobacterales bacterium]